jgi:NitT/TauT family transport system substrate-binding protein
LPIGEFPALRRSGLKVRYRGQPDNDGLIVKPTAPILQTSRKTLGTCRGSSGDDFAAYVRAAGLDPDKDVKLVDLAVAMQVPAVVGGTVA